MLVLITLIFSALFLFFYFFRYPHKGFYILVATLPLQVYSFKTGIFTLNITNTIILFLSFGLLSKILFVSRTKSLLLHIVKHHKLKVICLLLFPMTIGLTSLSIVNSTKTSRLVITGIGSVALVVLAIFILDSHVKLKKAIIATTFGVLCTSLIAVIGSISPELLPDFVIKNIYSTRTGILPYRSSGIEGPGSLGSSIFAVLPILIYFGKSKLKSNMRNRALRRRKHRNLKLISVACAFVLAIAIFSSQTRSTILIFLLLMLYVIIWNPLKSSDSTHKMITVVKILISVPMIFLSLFIFQDLLLQKIWNPILELNIKGYNYRMLQYEIAFEMIAKNPIVGSGIEGYTEVIYQKTGSYHALHNAFLSIAAFFGIAGISTSVLFLISSIRSSYAQIIRFKICQWKIIGIGLLTGLVAQVIQLQFYPEWPEKIFWLILGFVNCYTLLSEKTINRRL